MSIKVFSRLILLAIVAGHSANAMQVNIETNLNLKTKYYDCQPKVLKIIELTALYMQADEGKKPALQAEIEKQKKKLKKCEKKNKKGGKTRINISPIIIGGSFNF